MRALALLLAAAALAAAGCGSDGASSTGATVDPERAVTDAQVNRAAAGTPQRAVLEWWRDVQVNDPRHARGLYAEPPSLPDLAGQFNFVAGRLDGSVAIVSTRAEGRRTVARARWTPPGSGPRRVTLRLAREGGGWKLLDTRFLDRMVAARQRAEAG